MTSVKCFVFSILCIKLQESRTERVDSWRDFQQKGSKKKKKKAAAGIGGLKPPKLKQEKR